MEEAIKEILDWVAEMHTTKPKGWNDEIVTKQATKQLLSLFDEVVEGICGVDEDNATEPGEVLVTDRIGYLRMEDVHRLLNGKANELRHQIKSNYSKLKEKE